MSEILGQADIKAAQNIETVWNIGTIEYIGLQGRRVYLTGENMETRITGLSMISGQAGFSEVPGMSSYDCKT